MFGRASDCASPIELMIELQTIMSIVRLFFIIFPAVNFKPVTLEKYFPFLREIESDR
jgi:hypothetical protein